jgi:hypothetical protein
MGLYQEDPRSQERDPTAGRGRLGHPSRFQGWIGSGARSAYSARNVIEGSTWVARQAGNQQAIPETTASRAITKK